MAIAGNQRPRRRRRRYIYIIVVVVVADPRFSESTEGWGQWSEGRNGLDHEARLAPLIPRLLVLYFPKTLDQLPRLPKYMILYGNIHVAIHKLLDQLLRSAGNWVYNGCPLTLDGL